jgi:hypothetical protein
MEDESSDPDTRDRDRDPMKSYRSAPMSADAYAGFLKLWITPSRKTPASSPEIDAYLRYASERSPLSAISRRALGQLTEHAA